MVQQAQREELGCWRQENDEEASWMERRMWEAEDIKMEGRTLKPDGEGHPRPNRGVCLCLALGALKKSLMVLEQTCAAHCMVSAHPPLTEEETE